MWERATANNKLASHCVHLLSSLSVCEDRSCNAPDETLVEETPEEETLVEETLVEETPVEETLVESICTERTSNGDSSPSLRQLGPEPRPLKFTTELSRAEPCQSRATLSLHNILFVSGDKAGEDERVRDRSENLDVEKVGANSKLLLFRGGYFRTIRHDRTPPFNHSSLTSPSFTSPTPPPLLNGGLSA
uniref:Uncharacterized protein n=1 Tax=Knipowitschia caucasica TaxID=637954 RepID=A0AAV2KPL6_KNICA